MSGDSGGRSASGGVGQSGTRDLCYKAGMARTRLIQLKLQGRREERKARVKAAMKRQTSERLRTAERAARREHDPDLPRHRLLASPWCFT